MKAGKPLIFPAVIVFLAAGIFLAQRNYKIARTPVIIENNVFTAQLNNLTDVNPKNLAKIENDMLVYLKDRGVLHTMAVLREAFSHNNLAIVNCHRLTHIVGHYAYKPYQSNVADLAANDAELCGQGYQHGVEAEIVLRSGQPIEDLHEFCIGIEKKYGNTPCYHGVGHAEMSSSLNVQESLNKCDKIVETGPFRDAKPCYQGVLSELASQIEGVDGDTGIAFAGGPKIKADFNFPLEYCQRLNEKYQESCAAQLSRIALDFLGLEKALNGCVQKQFSPNLQTGCVNIISAQMAEEKFNKLELVAPPVYESTWNDNLRHAYIDGIAGEFWAQILSGKELSAESVCNNFSLNEDKNYCLLKLRKI